MPTRVGGAGFRGDLARQVKSPEEGKGETQMPASLHPPSYSLGGQHALPAFAPQNGPGGKHRRPEQQSRERHLVLSDHPRHALLPRGHTWAVALSSNNLGKSSPRRPGTQATPGHPPPRAHPRELSPGNPDPAQPREVARSCILESKMGCLWGGRQVLHGPPRGWIPEKTWASPSDGTSGACAA